MAEKQELKENTTITILPSVKKKAAVRAKTLKRSLSSHIEYLLEEDLKR